MTGKDGNLLARNHLPVSEYYKAMETLADAGMISPGDIFLKNISEPDRKNKLVDHIGAKADQKNDPEQQDRFAREHLAPCEREPGHLDCSEYPAGLFTPQYSRAKLGPNIKVCSISGCDLT
jgi:hypothetical protein